MKPSRSHSAQRGDAPNQRVVHDLLCTIARRTHAHFIVSPGGRNAPLTFAIAAHYHNHSTVILDERVAAFYALGRARVNRDQLCVLVSTSGSAGAHYLPAIIEADYAGIPLLLVTCDRPDRLRHSGAAQTIEQRAFFGHHVLASAHFDANESHSATVTHTLDTLLEQALTKQGPVHLNLGFDEPLCPMPTPSMPATALESFVDEVNAATVVRIAEILKAQPKGIIIFGPSAASCGAERTAWMQFMETLNWPCFAHGASNLRGSNSRCIEEMPLDHYLRSNRRRSLERMMVIYVGQAPTSRRVLKFLEEAPLVLSLSHGRHAVNPWKSALAFAGLSAPLIDAIRTHLTSAEAEETPRHRRTRDQGWGEGALNNTLWSGAVLQQIADHLPSGTVLQVSNSLIIRDWDNFVCHLDEQVHVFANRGVNGIDGQIATVCGLAARNEMDEAVLVCGDLTALHDANALLLAQTLAVKIFVLHNGGGAIFDELPFADGTAAFRKFFTTPQRPRIEEIAKSYGFTVFEVREHDALGQTINAVFKAEGPALACIYCDPKTDRDGRHMAAERLTKRIECTHE